MNSKIMSTNNIYAQESHFKKGTFVKVVSILKRSQIILSFLASQSHLINFPVLQLKTKEAIINLTILY